MHQHMKSTHTFYYRRLVHLLYPLLSTNDIESSLLIHKTLSNYYVQTIFHLCCFLEAIALCVSIVCANAVTILILISFLISAKVCKISSTKECWEKFQWSVTQIKGLSESRFLTTGCKISGDRPNRKLLQEGDFWSAWI